MLCGLTGVAKAGNDRHTVLQRLIMHIKLSNWDQNVVMGDMPQLPTSGRWRCSVLESGVTLVWFGKISCAVSMWSRSQSYGARVWPSTVPEAHGMFFPGSTDLTVVCWLHRYSICFASNSRLKSAAIGRCHPRIRVPLVHSRSCAPLEEWCQQRPLAKSIFELGGTPLISCGSPAQHLENLFRGSDVESAARAVNVHGERADHKEELVATAAIVE